MNPSNGRLICAQFAVSLGYEIDRRESWRGSTVLRRGADKIVVKRNGNGHYVFFSVRDDSDNGTVIDFLQRRQNLSLGAVRQILRPWVGRPATSPQFPKLEPARPDRMHVESEYRRMAKAQRSSVSGARALSAGGGALIAAVCGPHADRPLRQHCVSSFRCRGVVRLRDQEPRIYRLCRGGEKGLWFSHTKSRDRHVVLAESAIDALSYATLFPDAEDQTRYASLGGKPSSRQTALVQAAIAKLPVGAEIVAAFDADDAGRKLVEMIREAVAGSPTEPGRTDLVFKLTFPAKEGEDWNQVLQNAVTDDSNWTCQIGQPIG